MLAFREAVHRTCDRDLAYRAVQTALCADDPAYFMVLFGVLYEPRETVDVVIDPATGQERERVRPPGWYPWVPFAFQVDVIRWHQQVMARPYDTMGRGDGILEKSRELGVSWLFCLIAVHGWLFLDNQTVMLMSKSAELVDNRGDPGSLFYKIRAMAGIYDRVPETSFAPGTLWDGLRCRVPEWMRPPIVPREHDFLMKLIHPTKANTIIGETTTSTAGTAGRATWIGIDEAAKIPVLNSIWGGLASVSFHRFAFSSASLLYGSDFYDLAMTAKNADAKGTPGPAYYRADWCLNPLRTENWLASERARSTNPHDFMREYEINYHADFGQGVYPFAQQMVTTDAPYRRATGPVACAIDPGITDPTAVLWLQQDATSGRHRVFEAVTLDIPSAKEIVPILMGFPPGHPVRDTYRFHPDADTIEAVMDTTWMLRQTGEAITFVGDPYGNNAGNADATSFYDVLFEESRRLAGLYPDLPYLTIAVRTKYDEGARFHRKRKESLTQLLPMLDIHDTPRCGTFLAALKDMRYRVVDPNKGAQTEPAKPLHTWASHLTTAAEFYAVHLSIRDAVTRMTASQQRVKLPNQRQRRQRVA